MLSAAQIPYVAQVPDIDEIALKQELRAKELNAAQLADALAEAKALPLSNLQPQAFVLGCDQTLSLENGNMIDKAVDQQDAASILRRLSGQKHRLHSAAVVAQGGEILWRGLEQVELTMRSLSDAFIEDYLDKEWEHICWCVGCYRIEGPGVQLFSNISGTQFAIQGLPMIGLLDFLRDRGVLAT
jgi:septum formation protein